MEAILHPDIVVLSVATRPDCITPETLSLLSELNEIKPVWIEFGLQTIHDETAAFIRREFSLSCYEQAVAELKRRDISVISHIILGLPGETMKQMLETVDYVAYSGISGVKLQLLHVLSDTDLADYYATPSVSSFFHGRLLRFHRNMSGTSATFHGCTQNYRRRTAQTSDSTIMEYRQKESVEHYSSKTPGTRCLSGSRFYIERRNLCQIYILCIV